MTDLFLSFLEISIPAGFLIGLLLLLTPFFDRRYAARWKYGVWVVLALRLLIPFGGTGGEPAAGLQAQMEMPAASESGKTVPDAPAAGTARGRVVVEIPAQMTAPLAALPEKAGNRISPLDMIAWIWAAGSALAISVPLAGSVLYRRKLRKKGSAVKDREVLRLLQELKCELGIRSAVPVVEDPDAFSPMLAGIFAPVLVLPKERYSAEELFFVLKHELVHLKRGDLYGKLLFEAVCAAHWWNPLVRAMQRQAAADMELSCDERVVKDFSDTQRRAYTEALLSMLFRQSAKKLTLSTNFYGGKKLMKKRFEHILAKTEKKNGAAMLICAAVLAMGLGTLVGCSVAPGSPAAVSGSSGAEGLRAGTAQSNLLLPPSADAAAFVPGMGCSDPACTDPAHHHDCPAGCADYEHHHACALDCTEASHHHAGTAANLSGNPGNFDNTGNSGGLDNSGNPGNDDDSGNSGGHHHSAGHHSSGHHG